MPHYWITSWLSKPVHILHNSDSFQFYPPISVWIYLLEDCFWTGFSIGSCTDILFLNYITRPSQSPTCNFHKHTVWSSHFFILNLATCLVRYKAGLRLWHHANWFDQLQTSRVLTDGYGALVECWLASKN